MTEQKILYSIIRINSEIETNNVNEVSSINTSWDIEKDISLVKQKSWVIILANIKSIEEYNFLIDLNNALNKKRIFIFNFISAYIHINKYQKTKLRSFIILETLHSFNIEIKPVLSDFLFLLRPYGIPCIDKSDIEYAFRNRVFNYYSINYKTYEELINSINNFTKRELTETTSQINFCFKANGKELPMDEITKIYCIFEDRIKKDNLLYYLEQDIGKTFFSIFYSNK